MAATATTTATQPSENPSLEDVDYCPQIVRKPDFSSDVDIVQLVALAGDLEHTCTFVSDVKKYEDFFHRRYNNNHTTDNFCSFAPAPSLLLRTGNTAFNNTNEYSRGADLVLYTLYSSCSQQNPFCVKENFTTILADIKNKHPTIVEKFSNAEQPWKVEHLNNGQAFQLQAFDSTTYFHGLDVGNARKLADAFKKLFKIE
ncbi:MAG: hypothetical protein ACPGUD_00885 [Parashewanella sp.]